MKFLYKNFLLVLLLFSLLFLPSVEAVSNPYGKYQDLYGEKTVRCTWYAWQQAYDNLGVVLPRWGNAQTWYNSAISDGFKVGKEARANSIVVWSSNDSYGHVAFVVSVDQENNSMIVNEGGIPSVGNEGILTNVKKSTTSSNLIGFIYLDEVPNKQNNPNSNNTISNANASKNKSSNNNLDTLDIDIDNFQFQKDVLEYNFEVSFAKKIIIIKAEAEDEKALVEGTGQKALKLGENNYSIIVTAENGAKKEYKINVNRLEPVASDKKVEKENYNVNKKDNLKIVIVSILSIISIIIVFLILRKKYKKNK